MERWKLMFNFVISGLIAVSLVNPVMALDLHDAGIMRMDISSQTGESGIDVSEHNGVVDWQSVYQSGVRFAFIRVGYRGWGTGRILSDIKADINIKNAKAAGIKVGAYFYSKALNTIEAAEEGNFVLSKIKDMSLDLPVMLDVEFDGKNDRLQSADLSRQQMTDNVLAFCNVLNNAGYNSGIYASKDFIQQNFNIDEITGNGNNTVWLAHWNDTTDYSGSFDFWQYQIGKVSGVKNDTDMDRWLYPGRTYHQGWKQQDGKWWYRNLNGSYPVSQWKTDNGQSYYFDEQGYMVTGWQQMSNQWYYFFPNGNAAGEGWQLINGSWYYFLSDHRMAIGWQAVNGSYYYLQQSGQMMQDGWLRIDDKWYLFDARGVMQSDLWTNGYYIKPNGEMAASEWGHKDNHWYYFNSDGHVVSGWQQIKNDWYYFDTNGIMQSDCWIGSYYLLPDGRMALNTWDLFHDQWYYLDSNGSKAVGWRQIDGYWYWFDENGVMASNAWISGQYYVNSSGRMLTDSWCFDQGKWYYLSSDGRYQTGWLYYNNNWYYLLNNGEMAVDRRVDQDRYYVDNNGVYQPGR